MQSSAAFVSETAGYITAPVLHTDTTKQDVRPSQDSKIFSGNTPDKVPSPGQLFPWTDMVLFYLLQQQICCGFFFFKTTTKEAFWRQYNHQFLPAWFATQMIFEQDVLIFLFSTPAIQLCHTLLSYLQTQAIIAVKHPLKASLPKLALLHFIRLLRPSVSGRFLPSALHHMQKLVFSA